MLTPATLSAPARLAITLEGVTADARADVNYFASFASQSGAGGLAGQLLSSFGVTVSVRLVGAGVSVGEDDFARPTVDVARATFRVEGCGTSEGLQQAMAHALQQIAPAVGLSYTAILVHPVAGACSAGQSLTMKPAVPFANEVAHFAHFSLGHFEGGCQGHEQVISAAERRGNNVCLCAHPGQSLTIKPNP